MLGVSLGEISIHIVTTEILEVGQNLPAAYGRPGAVHQAIDGDRAVVRYSGSTGAFLQGAHDPCDDLLGPRTTLLCLMANTD